MISSPPSRLAFTSLLLLLLVGCANQPPKSPKTITSATELEHWRIKGKLGITLPNDRISAFIDWQQDSDTFNVKLNGPFGRGLTTIEGNNLSLTLETGDQVLTGKDAESVMLEKLGWSVPVKHFSFWARGLSSPLTAITAVEYNQDGSLQWLTQDGWEVRFNRYEPALGINLPGKISASAAQLKLLLVIKDWQHL